MSLTKVSFSMLNGAPVNVFDFMSAAQIASVLSHDLTQDVTSAVRAAIDSVATTTTGASLQVITGVVPSKAVYFPSGRYKISSTIDVKSYTKIIGDGHHNTIFTSYITDGTPVFKVRGDLGGDAFYNSFEDFGIDGQGNNCTGLYLLKCHRWTLNNIYIGSTTNCGLYTNEAYTGESYGLICNNCGNASGIPAVWLTGPSEFYGGNAIHFFGGEITNTPYTAIQIDYAYVCNLNSMVIENNNGYGVYIGDGTKSVLVQGCYLEDNIGVIRLGGVNTIIVNNNFGFLRAGTPPGASTAGAIVIGTASYSKVTGNAFPPCTFDYVREDTVGSSSSWNFTYSYNNTPFGKNDLGIDGNLLGNNNNIIKFDGTRYSSTSLQTFDNTVYAMKTLAFPSGAWSNPPIQIQGSFLWVDGSGRLRIKGGAPTSDTDGTVVGTQT